jgi:HK97 family phage prohead protease
MNDMERRFTRGLVEVRASQPEKRAIGGYAAKFNKPSQNLGGFVEYIAPKAFNRSRGNEWPDVVARYNHDDAYLLGRTSSGTLQLDIDDDGLLYEVDVPRARAEVYELVQRRDITQSSFAFKVIGSDGEEWGLNEQDYPMRTLHSVELIDVAPVNSPAYLDTSTAVRSLARQVHADPEEVRALAQEGELRKFFRRTDGPAPKKTLSGAEARLMLLKNPIQHP